MGVLEDETKVTAPWLQMAAFGAWSLATIGICTAALAQAPGATPPLGPPPPATPKTPVAPTESRPASPAPARSFGPYYRQGVGGGGFFVIDRGLGRNDIARPALNFYSELGLRFGPILSVFLSAAITFHHYDTARDYARWIYTGRDFDKSENVALAAFLTPTIIGSVFADTQTATNLGVRVYFLPRNASPFIEAGGGLSFTASRFDGVYGGFYGGQLGAGYRLHNWLAVTFRAFFSPTFGTANADTGTPIVTSFLFLEL